MSGSGLLDTKSRDSISTDEENYATKLCENYATQDGEQDSMKVRHGKIVFGDSGLSRLLLDSSSGDDSLPLSTRGAHFEPRSPGAAPIIHIGGSSFCFHHHRDCHYNHNPEALDALASAAHTSRSFCNCMSNVQIDKSALLEFHERNQTINAFYLLQEMKQRIPLLDDPDFDEIIYRYEACLFLYQLLAEVENENSSQLYENMIKQMQACGPISTNPWVPLKKATADNLAGNGALPNSSFSKKRNSANGWKRIVNDGQKCKVWYKLIPGTTELLFRLEGVVQASLVDVVSVMAEVDYTSKWVPFISFPFRMGLAECKCIARKGRFDKISYYDTVMPWPFKNRCACIHGWMVDDLERNNTLTFGYRTLDPDAPVVEDFPIPTNFIPPVGPNTIRVNFDGGATLTPLSDNSVMLRMVCLIDPKEKFSTTLINFFAGHFMKMAFSSFSKQCFSTAADSDYIAVRSTDHWLYSFLRSRMNEAMQFSNQSSAPFSVTQQGRHPQGTHTKDQTQKQLQKEVQKERISHQENRQGVLPTQ